MEWSGETLALTKEEGLVLARLAEHLSALNGPLLVLAAHPVVDLPATGRLEVWKIPILSEALTLLTL